MKTEWIFAALGLLAWVSVAAQQPLGLADPFAPMAASDDRVVDTAPRYRVSGVLVSPSGRVAIINDKLAREGDVINGATIVAIEPATVHMRIGTREVTAHVGSNTLVDRVSRAPALASAPRDSAPRDSATPMAPPTGEHIEARGSTAVPPQAGDRHVVTRGETLSEIAERYRRDEFSRNQIMIALFETNPLAFDRNINVLHENAVLELPGTEALARYSHAQASATVAQHEADWRAVFAPDTVRAAAASARQRTSAPELENIAPSYGPVATGETLSGIASRLARDGVTLDQIMIALFEANPTAFGGNINVLYAGASLRVPNLDVLRSQAPRAASAEVLRHHEAWREADPRQARAPASATLRTDHVEPALIAFTH